MSKHTDGGLVPCTELGGNLKSYLDVLSAIVWRIDIVGKEISFLNTFTFQPHEEKVRAIMQNPQSAQRMILADDRERFQQSYKQLLHRQKTTCIFRIQMENGMSHWFKLAGMPDPEHPTCSIGVLMDISSHVSTILATEGRPGLSVKIDLIDDPVLLVRFADRSVSIVNKAADQLLGYSIDQLADLHLQDLLRDTPGTDLFQIYESLIFSDYWNGELYVTDSMGRSHQCLARIQVIARDEENLLWITLSHQNDCKACKGVPVRGNETLPTKAVSAAMRKSTTVKALLDSMLRALPHDSPTDAIMLSKIFIDKGIVAVTGVGEPFGGQLEDLVHPYEGSIAKNIVHFELDKHVVMETSKSIKPIDWALFIPHGIHSYYAHPFFENGILTKVLIFCSTQKGSYDPDADAPLSALLDDFFTHLNRILKKHP
ncbi:diguanylate cyclase [Pseudodesulfovibrio sp. JC047]|uniref:PAS domain-containing protein n=1 Tax=Pseudodesulfovibrio sp. JC047 TaxID=2683199 RepID=UPI0013D63B26|nr:PAS domain-containing protein [Pseudodesulfovibrio sp. JC047]NDV18456.1 diguanylate cyclase [Pseudodesulfovibrio sp. JC047]